MDYDIPTPQKLQLGTWRKMAPFFKLVRRQFTLAVILILFAALLDVISPLFIRFAIDWFVVPQTTDGLWLFLGIQAVVVLLQGVVTIFFQRKTMEVDMELARHMRSACFTHLQKLSLAYYNKTPVGYILARIMSDIARISGLTSWGVVFGVWNMLYLLGVAVIMLILDWRLALILIVVIPIVIAVTALFKNRLLKVNREIRSVNAKVTGLYNEGIAGAKATKTLVIEDKLAAEFSGVTQQFYRAGMRMNRLNVIFIPLMVFLCTMAAAVGLYYGGILVMEQVVALGTLSVFLTYSVEILEPVRELARLFSDFAASQVNVERVADLLANEPMISDTPEVEAQYGDIFTPRPENWERVQGNIEFRGIDFRYPDGEEYVLKQFNLNIPAGTTIAIVGRTGAGKSTLVNLACRFLEPTRGTILIDGTDYRRRSMLWLQSHLGYVLQNPHLFSGTVMENIRYGRLDATDEEVIAAAKLAAVDQVVEKLENGYHTEVGEGGGRLSTGEKQLISFARAILADPPIFVLDEATSSIDTETELLIQDAISHILKGRTSFIIAHRLSTIRHADLILVVEQGKIIEQGSHKDLIQAKGHYHGLYTAMLRQG